MTIITSHIIYCNGLTWPIIINFFGQISLRRMRFIAFVIKRFIPKYYIVSFKLIYISKPGRNINLCFCWHCYRTTY